jgi:hypothetical protein
MAERQKDSRRSISDAQARLEARYHEIGISAVAAAMRFCNLPDEKEPAHDPGPAQTAFGAADKAA